MADLGQGSSPNTGSRSPNPPWFSTFFTDNVVSDEIEEAQSCGHFFWVSEDAAPLAAEEAECSAEGGGGGGGEARAEGGGGEAGAEGDNKRENDGEEGGKKDGGAVVIARKREREESGSTASCSKANREKMRRDRLNERFTELSALLEPGRQPKTDKASILVDAIRVVSQLRREANHLRENNDHLSESIKDLKAEKNELRGDKARLKLETERLEAQSKSMVPATYLTHPAASAAPLATPLAPPPLAPPHAQKVGTPPVPFPPGFMWQWIAPSSLDTSQDGVLRPPVA